MQKNGKKLIFLIKNSRHRASRKTYVFELTYYTDHEQITSSDIDDAAKIVKAKFVKLHKVDEADVTVAYLGPKKQ